MKTVSFSMKTYNFVTLREAFKQNALFILVCLLGVLSLISFIIYFTNGLGLAYNDARSHLNIGRRVVEGLKPGFAQIGSVWLPLTHVLMIPTIWSDFMWHSGLSGAVQSMASYMFTGVLIFTFLRKIGVSVIGCTVGTLVFALNPNVLYLQSTAMTELLLLATMTAGVYELVMWHRNEQLVRLIRSAFWIMCSTLIRYDGWFLFVFSAGLIALYTLTKYGYKKAEGAVLFFCVLAGFGLILWFGWNMLIFKDPFYFAFGPYSAHAQQAQLEEAGVLATKHNLPLSLIIYLYAMMYNSTIFSVMLAAIGAILFFTDKNIPGRVRYASLALLSPFAFNVIALYLGHSVLFVQGLSGNSWFNVRYGIMMMPSIAILIGYLVHRVQVFRPVLIGLLLFSMAIGTMNADAVTIDDARSGSSGKNVTEVSGWLTQNTKDKEGFILISAASHDAIIFSSGLPMKRFIHEGTGLYWDKAVAQPHKWARWIIMRTEDNNDLTYRMIKQSGHLDKYTLVDRYPFADIYELKPQYVSSVETKAVLGPQK